MAIHSKVITFKKGIKYDGIGVSKAVHHRNNDMYLTVIEIAEKLKKSPEDVLVLINNGQISAVETDCGKLVPEAVFQKFQATHCTQPLVSNQKEARGRRGGRRKSDQDTGQLCFCPTDSETSICQGSNAQTTSSPKNASCCTYKGIYAMHKYWGKKPFNEICKFIEKYTAPSETVLDCFCGSGVTLVEAIKAGRKCVGLDINPIALNIAKVSMTPVTVDLIKETFAKIEKKLREKIYSLYEITENGERALVTHVIWEKNKPKEVWYSQGKQRKIIREGNERDIDMALHPAIEPLWYPTTLMWENSRLNVNANQHINDMFTPRALVGLSLLLDEIKKIENKDLRDIFELTFTGTLSQASNLVFVIRRRKKKNSDKIDSAVDDLQQADATEQDDCSAGKAEVGSWVIGYWVPEEHFEINVWNCFKNRFKRVLKGEEEINNLFSATQFKDNVQLIHGSATDIPLQDNSVDYVFIDPPHANRILYMEQSLMWNAWLGLDDDLRWNDEIVVTEAKKRKEKDSSNYNKLLDRAFAEIKRVLKPEKHFSLAFNCLEDDTWIDILNLFNRRGFVIEDIVPLEYSATSVIQDNRQNALKTDFVLTFTNSDAKAQQAIAFKDSVEDNKMLVNKVVKLLQDNPAYEVYNVMNALFEETIPQGFIYRVSQIVKTCAELLDKK